MRLRDSLSFATIVLLAILAAPAVGAGISLDALMGLLAQSGPIEARYTEMRHSPLLAEPVKLQGRVVIDPAGRFVKTTEGEDAATVRLDGETVVMTRGSETSRVSLDNFPMMQLLVDGLFALTRGDAAALQERFRVAVSGTAGDWRLTLEPRIEFDPDNLTAGEPTGLVRLVVEGSEGRFRRMVLEQSAGQRTVMTFRPQRAQ